MPIYFACYPKDTRHRARTVMTMGKALDVTNRFYEAWNKKDAKMLRAVLAADATYRGPLAQWNGVDEFVGEASQIMKQGFDRVEVAQQFERGDDVLSLTKLHLRTPKGPLTMEVAELTRVRGGLVAESRTFYDPRPLLEAAAAE